MPDSSKPLIAVIGATGNQGGSVLRALQATGKFRTRALTRNPEHHEGIADEVVVADMDSPETLAAAFEGAHGVFVVTNFFQEGGADEFAQGSAAVHAAKAAGVDHFVWSTLPNVEEISGGKFDVPHFTNKARVDAVVSSVGFAHYSFVILPFLFQNLLKDMKPQPQQDGSTGWTLPIDPMVRGIHAGDVNELGPLVAGAFANPDIAGSGQYLPLVGQFLSFGDIVSTLNEQGHDYSFNQVAPEVFGTFFPGAPEFAAMLGYFQAHTYLGSDRAEEIALARKVAGRDPTDFATWARLNLPVQSAEAGNVARELANAR